MQRFSVWIRINSSAVFEAILANLTHLFGSEQLWSLSCFHAVSVWPSAAKHKLKNRKSSCRNKNRLELSDPFNRTLCFVKRRSQCEEETGSSTVLSSFPAPHWLKLGTYWLTVTYTKTSHFSSGSHLSSRRSQFDHPGLDSHTVLCGFKRHQSHQTCKSECYYWCLRGEKSKNSRLLRDVFVFILNVCFCSKPSCLSRLLKDEAGGFGGGRLLSSWKHNLRRHRPNNEEYLPCVRATLSTNQSRKQRSWQPGEF